MREHLQSISPNNNIEKINVPILVVQGENDPRVPVTESEQVVKSLEEKQKTVWYMNALNEGHGFRKKKTETSMSKPLFYSLKISLERKLALKDTSILSIVSIHFFTVSKYKFFQFGSISFGLKKLKVKSHWLGLKSRIKKHLLDILNQMNSLSNIRKSKQSSMTMKDSKRLLSEW